ncbi:hypothetical protein [Gordonia sp. NPDC003422]
MARGNAEEPDVPSQAQLNRVEQILADGGRIGEQLAPLERVEDPAAFLYDEDGLPG